MKRLNKVIEDGLLKKEDVKHVQVIYYNLRNDSVLFDADEFWHNEYIGNYYAACFHPRFGFLKLVFCVEGDGDKQIVMFD